MLNDLKLAFSSAVITSASFSQAGVFGYGAVVAIAVALLCTLGRAIWRLLLEVGRNLGKFKLRNMPVARQPNERPFNSLLLLATSNMALTNKTCASQERRYVQP